MAMAMGLVLVAAMPAAVSAAPKPQFFHVSAYGIQRQNIVETWVAAPCQPGGQGGGYDGVLTVNSRMTWETMKPGKGQFVRFGNEGFFNALPGKGWQHGIRTTVTINREVNDDVKLIRCAEDGTPLPSLNDPRNIGTKCPQSISFAYGFFYSYNKGKLKTIFTGSPLGSSIMNKVYQDCYGNLVANDGIHVEIPAPVSELANPGLGKITTTQRFSKKLPGVAEGSLTMTNTLAGKTYVNLKRLKQG
ncbi:MAG TPA: hypothetical protein VJU14_13060 [Solirubrobacterales bacterium]|nr:hypothetical protein [Solirubrobacterales bacterium]